MPKDSAGRFWSVLVANVAVILASVYVSLTHGEFDIPVMDVIGTLLGIEADPAHRLVLFEFRLPRIAAAALVGFGLGIAGAVIQGLTRNGLADPGILGINAGAGTAIVVFMFFTGGSIAESGWLSAMGMPLFGWIGGVATALFIYFFSWRNGVLDPQRLILVGIAAGAGLGALSLYLSLKLNPQDFEMATVWLLGSIWNANWKSIASMLPWLILFVPVLLHRSLILDLFQLGDEAARGLGVSTETEKKVLLLLSIGIVSACVSVSGNIGFVGLMAPHIAKRLVGLRHRHVLPVCGTFGMLLVIVADWIAKVVFAPVELSAGVVLSIIGAPYFIYLLFSARREQPGA